MGAAGEGDVLMEITLSRGWHTWSVVFLLSLVWVPSCTHTSTMSHFEASRQWLKKAHMTDAEVFLMGKRLQQDQEPDLVITDTEFLEQVRAAIVQHSVYCGYDPRTMPPGCGYAFWGDGHAAQIYLNYTHPAPAVDMGRDSMILNIHGCRFSFFGEAFDQDSFTSPRLAALLLDFFSGRAGFQQVCEALRFLLAHMGALGRVPDS